MTADQFYKLFEDHTYSEARSIIREEIKRLGKSTGANDTKLQLFEKAVDGVPMAEFKEAKPEARGDGNPLPNPGSGEQGDKSKDGGDSKPMPIPQPQPKPEPQPQPKPQPKPDGSGDAKSGGGDEKIPDSEDFIKEQIRKAEEEARKREEEARKQREDADKFKRQLEEMKRKLEEDRKRREEAAKKKGKHYKTDDVIDTLKTTGIAYLVGPAGTGKSTLAMDACEVMFNVSRKDDTDKFSKVFAQISFTPDTTSGEMIGRSDVNGVFHESEIVRVFRDGGLILFDEIDDADSAMLIKLNTAIANGMIATPNGMVKRNENTYIVCTANTYGTGPDAMYVGRSRLDAATLDRFVLSTIEVDYDTKLEKLIANPLSQENRDWLLGFVKKVRKVIKDNKIRKLCSTRMVINATKFLANGKDQKFIQDRFLIGWDATQRNAVLAA